MSKDIDGSWKNLAPEIIRQRLIIEGLTKDIVKIDAMKTYLSQLAGVVNTRILSGPHAYKAHELGFGGWIHWRSSGAHIYSYPTKPPLLTVDIYTCRPFSISKALDFTKQFFSLIEVVHKEITV